MDIPVYASWKELKEPTLMGVLSATHTKGREVFSFTYANDRVDNGPAQNLDPDLQHFKGPQYLPNEKNNFGIFLD